MSPEELVRTCTDSQNAEAWAEFIGRFHRVIATVALRTARHWIEPSSSILDDLVQETYLKLCADGCRVLREFQPRHPDSIFGYLKVLTANVVHDHFKSLHSRKRGAGVAQEPIGNAEEASTHAQHGSGGQLERNILLNEIDRCLNECAPGPEQHRNRVIFWLYYRGGLTATAIAAIPSLELNTKGVESTILRLTRAVRDRIAIGREGSKHVKNPGTSSPEGIVPSESF